MHRDGDSQPRGEPFAEEPRTGSLFGAARPFSSGERSLRAAGVLRQLLRYYHDNFPDLMAR